MTFEVRTVVVNERLQNRAYPRIIGYNVSEDGGHFEFVPADGLSVRLAAP